MLFMLCVGLAYKLQFLLCQLEWFMNQEAKNQGLERKVPPAVSRREPGAFSPTGSQLISFEERLTYTFAHGREVGAVHFDRGRGEIFYKGHNIRNMDLEEWQWQVMEKLRQILAQDQKNKVFAAPYGKTLDKILLEKKRNLSDASSR